jgi:MoxR-like ATPase
MKQVMVGKTEVIDLLMVSMLCSGHVLLEDVPGLGKTVMAKSLAKSIEGTFHRIQFTPDLLPSDVSGINFFNQKEGDFQFRRGPVFCHILLADEINRATPRTQSSLLEAMEERQVTIDGETHMLEAPFMVIATQNPIESQGTFPLPEAQLDRFFMKIAMGYPSAEDECEILKRVMMSHPVDSLKSVTNVEKLLEAQEAAKKVIIADDVLQYIVNIVQKTRNHPHIAIGASPRGSIALMKGAKAFAMLNGRDYVKPDDVKYLAPFILGHRMTLDGAYVLSGEESGEFIEQLLMDVTVPLENEIA